MWTESHLTQTISTTRARRPLSLTPRFSGVIAERAETTTVLTVFRSPWPPPALGESHVQRLSFGSSGEVKRRGTETVKTVLPPSVFPSTSLKRGVNGRIE